MSFSATRLQEAQARLREAASVARQAGLLGAGVEQSIRRWPLVSEQDLAVAERLAQTRLARGGGTSGTPEAARQARAAVELFGAASDVYDTEGAVVRFVDEFLEATAGPTGLAKMLPPFD